ncbi:MAG: MFS transporter [Kiloniellales bacterium]
MSEGKTQDLSRNDVTFIAHRVTELTSINLGGAQLVLPFLYTALSGPALIAAFLMPVYRAAVLASGTLAAPYMSKAGAKRSYLIVGMALILAGLLVVVLMANGQWGATMLAAIFLLSSMIMGIGKGVHSIAENSIIAGLWEVSRRGSLMGSMQALTGIVSVILALATLFSGSSSKTDPNMTLVWGAVAAAAISLVLAILVREGNAGPKPKTVERRQSAWTKAKSSYRKLTGETWYRRMLVARVLLVSVEYGTAFYAIHAASKHGTTAGALAAFAVATALGTVTGGALARHVLRHSERLGLAIGGALGCLAALGALAGEVSDFMNATWVYCGVFFVLTVAAVCTYTARDAYLMACAEEEDLENGLALTKVVMDPVTIVFITVMGSLAEFQHPAVPIAAIGLMSLGGIFAVLAMPHSRHLRVPEIKSREG